MESPRPACPAHPPALPEAPAISDEDRALAGMAKALGHPARAAIVRYLSGLSACFAGDIVDVIPLAQSTVSQHLKKLRDAGLVQGEVDGPRVCYWVDRDALARLRQLLDELT